MTKEFLKQSAKHDGNDLSPVVAPGGHWCICAWAWASAVARDPKDAEGLKLDCAATNGHIRQVYEADNSLPGPTGNTYETKAALNKVNALCSQGSHLRQNLSDLLPSGAKSTLRRSMRSVLQFSRTTTPL